jgi:predicted secreted protein
LNGLLVTALSTYRGKWQRRLAAMLVCLLCCATLATAQETPLTQLSDSVTSAQRAAHRNRKAITITDTTKVGNTHPVRVVNASGDTITFASIDSIKGIEGVEILMDSTASPTMGKVRVFNPDPQRALWLSALCPGLGQIYNRRYWKLPIVVGAFVGLSYGAAWNNRMYKDYSKGFRDVMDDDPDTRSYMDFFPPTVKESDLDMAWLQKVMKSKRDYYRRYREICVISMVGVYLINIVDAYVDASLAHFDISPDLTLDVSPTAIDNTAIGGRLPSLGVQCAISF